MTKERRRICWCQEKQVQAKIAGTMPQNPYEPPAVAAQYVPRESSSTVKSLRMVIAILVAAQIIQWIFHLLTAIAMVAWMKKAEGGPTAQILDQVFYGFICVGITAMISIGTAVLGI